MTRNKCFREQGQVPSVSDDLSVLSTFSVSYCNYLFICCRPVKNSHTCFPVSWMKILTHIQGFVCTFTMQRSVSTTSEWLSTVVTTQKCCFGQHRNIEISTICPFQNGNAMHVIISKLTLFSVRPKPFISIGFFWKTHNDKKYMVIL